MTTTPVLDAPLLDRTDPALARPLPSALAEARAVAVAAAQDLAAIPENALATPWAWIGGSEDELRYAAYRAAEALELAEIDARKLTAAADAGERQAARLTAPATAARWDLHGLLLPLSSDLLDADPGNDEWPIRTVLGHLVSGQRAYGWGTAWWLANPHEGGDPGLPESTPESLWATLVEDADAAPGSLDDIRAALDSILDLSAERLAGLPDDRLGLGARWSGFAVTIGFRLGRWSSHIREHVIQIEKTLAMLGRAPSEPERLVRHVLAAYGRAEAAVFGRADVDDAVRRVAAGADEAREVLADARRAAGV